MWEQMIYRKMLDKSSNARRLLSDGDKWWNERIGLDKEAEAVVEIDDEVDADDDEDDAEAVGICTCNSAGTSGICW